MSAEICEACGQHIKDAHKEVFNKHKLTMLQDAARYVIRTNCNDFRNRDVGSGGGDVSNYNNFQKLRYHGLIAHVTENGVKQRNRWLITRNGWAFLRGEIDMLKWVRVRDNRIVERSEDRISVKDVYRGASEIATTFEYFDHDTGRPVGVRPLNNG